jgi:multicomponent Na+:H+ antiporter subunit F
VVGICALWAVIFKLDFLIDIALAWILLAFIGTLALAKYLSGKKFNE